MVDNFSDRKVAVTFNRNISQFTAGETHELPELLAMDYIDTGHAFLEGHEPHMKQDTTDESKHD